MKSGSIFVTTTCTEYGHLLGLQHSGFANNDYADSTCHMGNQLPWNDEGARACFNAAKMWYLNWFEWRHITINPNSSIQNGDNKPFFNGNLVTLDDTVNKNTSGEKMILKIEGDATEFFLMYNRAKGVNAEVKGYRDRITITQQNHESAISKARAGLSIGEDWSYQNFAGSGKSLIVKFCSKKTDSLTGKDTARILVYLKGKNDQYCPNTPPANSSVGSTPSASNGSSPNGGSSSTCYDLPGWKDSAGDGCAWYATNNNCNTSGFTLGKGDNQIPNTANDACCACGGGSTTKPTDASVSNNAAGGSISSKSAGGSVSNNSVSNNSAGGSVSNNIGGGSGTGGPTCEDEPGWYDNGGTGFNCEWYGRNSRNCELFGHKFKNFGKTANQACCVCK